ncbi:aromatic ring-hydroxylating dioxygenase subunit alpha [Amycolatopsis sp. NPDC098790]|uniref:aromatic ring-hydroxylating oxygenase subunit alpha n=1 Tax=Amycolatopsis sp. NPDC098790 TaxID=3363939 RepID=UPI00381381F5
MLSATRAPQLFTGSCGILAGIQNATDDYGTWWVMANESAPSTLLRQHIKAQLGIPRDHYVSPELFDRELETIFNRSWLYAGHESQLRQAGDYLTVESGAESVIVARKTDGGLAAYHNVCRHRGARLVTPGCGTAKRLVCPYHQWAYRMDGTLQGAPKMPPGFDPAGHRLAAVHVESWHGLVFVNLADQLRRSLADQLDLGLANIAPFDLASARIAHTVVYDVAANWKLVWENAQECYHCSANHPELLKTADVSGLGSSTENEDYVFESDDNIVRSSRLPLKAGATSLTIDGLPASAKLLGDFARGRQPYTALIHLKPTFAMACCPDYAVILEDRPQATDRTEVRMTWLVREDAVEGVDYDLDNLATVWDRTNRQDWALCERTQQGVRSQSFVPGPLSSNETSVAGFHRAYANLLAEAGL